MRDFIRYAPRHGAGRPFPRAADETAWRACPGRPCACCGAGRPVTHAETAMVPARPPRDTRLDILRGWLQLTIFVSHAGTGWLYKWLVYGTWGLSDSSEQFMFLSGYVPGSVFACKM